MAYRRTPAVQERLDAQRARLLEAATTAVATHGYAGCSIAAVAKNAGVGTGTLYRHFDGKGELFAEVFQSVCSREVSAARDAGDSARHLEGNHRSAVSASVRTFADVPCAHRFSPMHCWWNR
jgi:AcrR family transcriptional regulator